MNKNFLLKHIGKYCALSQQTISVAESCTGGLLAAALTKLPNSSTWFERGFVTYSNASKESLLGVSKETLAQHGAVSRETAQMMAEGTLKNSPSQIALAITGIAGPSGGSEEKPVGTVWFAISCKNKAALTYLKKFEGSRSQIRKEAVYFALHLLYKTLQE
jgi:nicotinamide-nucleotide amidase